MVEVIAETCCRASGAQFDDASVRTASLRYAAGYPLGAPNGAASAAMMRNEIVTGRNAGPIRIFLLSFSVE